MKITHRLILLVASLIASATLTNAQEAGMDGGSPPAEPPPKLAGAGEAIPYNHMRMFASLDAMYPAVWGALLLTQPQAIKLNAIDAQKGGDMLLQKEAVLTDAQRATLLQINVAFDRFLKDHPKEIDKPTEATKKLFQAEVGKVLSPEQLANVERIGKEADPRPSFRAPSKY